MKKYGNMYSLEQDHFCQLRSNISSVFSVKDLLYIPHFNYHFSNSVTFQFETHLTDMRIKLTTGGTVDGAMCPNQWYEEIPCAMVPIF
jgi:hypothetical protein